ncbi:MAG TPA: peptidoglycan-binding domain-containing protein [Pirellulales bacterium]|jgi:peptidoglycan hydrolase-like protein with peptidoglycan-binding domain|nr:peptidoglycan-binding domain-containing protein [Pirellulales bacterium]
MQLKANFWNDFTPRTRVDQAGTTPFHSIHLASRDNGTPAVEAVQAALKRIADKSPQLVFPFVPDPDVTGFRWGPFDIVQSEIDDSAFGTSTDLAVQRFQKQAALQADGKAGMDTLGQIDSMLAFLEIPAPPPSPFDF